MTGPVGQVVDNTTTVNGKRDSSKTGNAKNSNTLLCIQVAWKPAINAAHELTKVKLPV